MAGGSEDADEGGLLGRVQSLVRAFGLLDELAKADGMSLSEIARKTELPRSTAHRLLTTMEALRYVEFDRLTNLWSVGIQAFTVGAAFVQTRDLGQLGRTIMRSLMSEVHHAVNIAVPENGGMCYVGQVAADGIRNTVVRTGACLPMHTTASRKVMMAHWEEDALDRFIFRRSFAKKTARSIVDGVQLREELASIRQRGYAVDDCEHAEGLRCVAALVVDRYGAPRASLSISDTISRMDRDRLDHLGPTLRLFAGQLSREIENKLGF